MNNPLYRLLEVDIGPQRLAATVTLADFAGYSLTADLLESELVDAINTNGSARPTPLRDLYLPSTTAATAFDQRECVGGPATLLAIARPARGSRPADFVLLIQERSARVVNVAGKLAVIPKAFHQPISEPVEEADLVTTLERELEEELLGRRDLELLSQDSQAELIRSTSCIAPNRWHGWPTGRGAGATTPSAPRNQPRDRELRIRLPDRHQRRGLAAAVRSPGRGQLGGVTRAPLLIARH
jgi:hypothetical protein